MNDENDFEQNSKKVEKYIWEIFGISDFLHKISTGVQLQC